MPPGLVAHCEDMSPKIRRTHNFIDLTLKISPGILIVFITSQKIDTVATRGTSSFNNSCKQIGPGIRAIFSKHGYIKVPTGFRRQYQVKTNEPIGDAQ